MAISVLSITDSLLNCFHTIKEVLTVFTARYYIVDPLAELSSWAKSPNPISWPPLVRMLTSKWPSWSTHTARHFPIVMDFLGLGHPKSTYKVTFSTHACSLLCLSFRGNSHVALVLVVYFSLFDPFSGLYYRHPNSR